MMKLKGNYTTLLLLLCLLICSCNRVSEKKLLGKWNYENNLASKWATDFADKVIGYSLMNSIQRSIYGYNYIEFHKDHKFNEVILSGAGDYLNGEWTLNKKDSTITLHYKGVNNKDEIWKIKVLNISDEELTLDQSKGNITIFKKDESFIENDSESYTTPELNFWRNRPLQPESESEITKRVKASIAFEIAFLKRGMKLKDYNMLIKPVILPIKLKNASIELLNYSNVPNTWKEVFYDSTQALFAYSYLRRKYIGTDLSWQQVEDPFFTDLQLLIQLNNAIKN